jgi:POT family proton-dependent oligopeptide transporter
VVLISGVGNYFAASIGILVGESGPLSTFAGVTIMAFIAGGFLYAIREKLTDWMHGAEHLSSNNFDERLDKEISVTGSHECIDEHHRH